MNTYNIEVKGITVLERVSPVDLDKSLLEVRGLVWTSGGSDEDIKVVLNSTETHCND